MTKNGKKTSLAFGLLMLLGSLTIFLGYLSEASKIALFVALPSLGSFLVYWAIKDDKLGMPTRFELLNPEDTYEVIAVYPEFNCLFIISRSSARNPGGEPILIEEKGLPQRLRQPGARFIPSKVPDTGLL